MRCLIGSEAMLVATSNLVQIVQFITLPQVPFLQPWARGLGLHDGELLPVVALARQTAAVRGSSSDSRGVVLQSGEHRWIVLVDRVVGLCRARIIGGSFFQSWNDAFPSEWLLDAATSENEVLPIINTSAMKGSIHG